MSVLFDKINAIEIYSKGEVVTVTVYSKPECDQCNATYLQFDKAGIEYTVVDLTADAEARDYVMSLGYRQAPVVVAGTQHWAGFRIDRIRSLTAA